MAKKVPKQMTVCANCGEDVSRGAPYCPRCGEERPGDRRSERDREVDEYSGPEYDDMPIRASHFFWFDGLLFTRWWYVPVGFIAFTILAVLLLVPNGSREIVVLVMLAIGAAATVAWLLFRRGRGERGAPDRGRDRDERI